MRQQYWARGVMVLNVDRGQFPAKPNVVLTLGNSTLQ